MLSPAEVNAFVADGLEPVRQAFSRELADECVDVVWNCLREQGVRRNDRSTWTRAVVWVSCPEGGPFAEAGTAPALWEAYDQLIVRSGGRPGEQ